jgi:hypothetical protein
MRGCIWLALLVAVAVTGARPAMAQSLEERRVHATREAELAHAAELTDRACGTHLKTGFAWSSFAAGQALAQNVVSWCQAALDAMEDLCSDPLGKQAVSEKVKALTCAGAAAPVASLAPDGTLTFSFSLTPNQNKLLVRDYLDKNL